MGIVKRTTRRLPGESSSPLPSPGEVCAPLYLSGSGRGNVCYLGFPLYYLQTPQVQAFFNELLPLFGEERR